MPYVDDQATLTLSKLMVDSASSIDRLWARQQANGMVMGGDPNAEADEQLASGLEAAARKLSSPAESRQQRSAYLNSLPRRPASAAPGIGRVSEVILDGQFARDLLRAVSACQDVADTSREYCDERLTELGSAQEAMADRGYQASHRILVEYTGVIERLEAAIASICRAATHKG